MKSIHVIAAELARLVPAMAQDTAINNEQIFLGKLKEFRNEVLEEAANVIHTSNLDRPGTAGLILSKRT